MSFTSELKKEMITRGFGRGKNLDGARRAALSAFIRTSGFLGETEDGPSFFIVSETENVAEFFMTTFAELFHADLVITRASVDRMSGRGKLLLQCPANLCQEVLSTLGLLNRLGGIKEGISASLIRDSERKIAYAKGAFLGGGSCTVPSESGKTGYHLEIVFSDGKTARDFCDMLSEFELIVRLVERKDTFVAYIKSKEVISDFLSIIGAKNALKKFSALVEKRDRANQDNRTQNCMAGNADKSAIASVKQVVAIKKLMTNGAFDDLSEELKTVAKARLTNEGASMQELADLVGVSKSCLNHRIRKLMELSVNCEKK